MKAGTIRMPLGEKKPIVRQAPLPGRLSQSWCNVVPGVQVLEVNPAE